MDPIIQQALFGYHLSDAHDPNWQPPKRRWLFNSVQRITKLQKLHCQSKKTARRASDMVRGRWFSGDIPVVVMKARNFDIGLDDGAVTPWIVHGLGECQNPRAHAYSVPDLAFLDEYGFSVKFE
ncbi:hypothetical protein IID10_20445, partial [candidate division KSB1 bacterium]|nr:hypothetical protein [candidate division KSB1 bacterium]